MQRFLNSLESTGLSSWVCGTISNQMNAQLCRCHLETIPSFDDSARVHPVYPSTCFAGSYHIHAHQVLSDTYFQPLLRKNVGHFSRLNLFFFSPNHQNLTRYFRLQIFSSLFWYVTCLCFIHGIIPIFLPKKAPITSQTYKFKGWNHFN